MPEALMLQLLEKAERWAGAAGTSLRRRAHWVPSSFVLSRRPEERALLAAAAELYDLIGATPEGCVLMAELGLNPEAGALPTHDELAARHADALPCICRSGATVAGALLPVVSMRSQHMATQRSRALALKLGWHSITSTRCWMKSSMASIRFVLVGVAAVLCMRAPVGGLVVCGGR